MLVIEHSNNPPVGASPPTAAPTVHLNLNLSLPQQSLRLSEVVAAMTYALDITEGQPEGHALRTCVIGMGVGAALGLDVQQRSDLYYALLLKDLGCSSNAAKIHHLFGADDLRVKQAFKTVDLSKPAEATRFVLGNAGSAAPLQRRLKHIVDVSLGRGGGHAGLIETRCERGADIARQMTFSEATAAAIRSLDEHWDGSGYPYRVAGEAIPLLGRILCLAQTAEVFFRVGGAAAARQVVAERSGGWFDPVVAAAFERAQGREAFWDSLEEGNLEEYVSGLEPVERRLDTDEDQLDRVAEAFARVIDAKSPWTFKHSERVRRFALGAAAHVDEAAQLSPTQQRRLSRAALLHDIGKLGVPNTILDKQSRLTDAELAVVRKHPAYSERILAGVEPFKELAQLAGGHHERMDGRGYHRGVPAAGLDFEVRLLAVADQFEALTSPRPYREGSSASAAIEILYRDVGAGADPDALSALERFLATPAAQPLLAPPAPDPDVPVLT